jgi:hypothetical protein
MYRYYLNDKNEKNNPHESRMINKFKLVKNPKEKKDYLFSQGQIDWGIFKDLVIEEKFDPVKEVLEKKRRIEEIKKLNQKPKSVIKTEKKEAEEKLKELEDKKEKAMSDKSGDYIDINKLNKNALIDRILLNDKNSIEESYLRKKKKDELISIVVEIERMNIVK